MSEFVVKEWWTYLSSNALQQENFAELACVLSIILLQAACTCSPTLWSRCKGRWILLINLLMEILSCSQTSVVLKTHQTMHILVNFLQYAVLCFSKK